jgi:hypothetical protein
VSQVDISGQLTVGPSGGGDGVFPSSTDTIQLATTPSPKQAQAATGALTRSLQSPSGYVTLDGVPGTVQQCNTFFLRCDSPLKLRLTFADLAGGPDIVSEVQVQGMLLIEPPSNGYIKLIEAQGSARIEYVAAGIM